MYFTFRTKIDRATADGIEKSSIIITDVRLVYVYARITFLTEKFTVSILNVAMWHLLRIVAWVSTTEQRNNFQMAIGVYLPF